MHVNVSPLVRFAFNQARFVFYAQYTIERDMIKQNISFEEAFHNIKHKTELGQKYLKHVSLAEMRAEDKSPGSFMDQNTGLGHWLNDEYGKYIEEFVDV